MYNKTFVKEEDSSPTLTQCLTVIIRRYFLTFALKVTLGLYVGDTVASK